MTKKILKISLIILGLVLFISSFYAGELIGILVKIFTKS